MSPGGTTRVAGVIGDPVDHSLSPAMHNAAFQALGLDWVYVAFPVPAGAGADAVRAVPTLGLGGLSVTMPHKADAARACDRLTDTAAALGAVNAVVPGPAGLVGDSTDGEGFLRALGEAGVSTAGAPVVVIGAGGAARAIAHALGAAGAAVTVAARRPDAAAEAAALAPGGRGIGLAEADGAVDSAVDAAVDAAALVVNATPLGMHGEELPFRTDLLGPRHAVVDIVYTTETPLLAAARARGAQTLDGLSMLVHQGAIAFELWTGRVPPLDMMRTAAQAQR